MSYLLSSVEEQIPKPLLKYLLNIPRRPLIQRCRPRALVGVINTYDPYLGNADPLSEGERGYHFSFKHTTHLSRLEMPAISQQGTMGCVWATAARTINDDGILERTHNHLSSVFHRQRAICRTFATETNFCKVRGMFD